MHEGAFPALTTAARGPLDLRVLGKVLRSVAMEATAKFDYEAAAADELSFRKGELLVVRTHTHTHNPGMNSSVCETQQRRRIYMSTQITVFASAFVAAGYENVSQTVLCCRKFPLNIIQCNMDLYETIRQLAR